MDSAAWAEISALVAASALVLSLWTALSARGRKEFDGLIASRTEHDERLTRLEGAIASQPKPSEFHDMRVAMEAIKGSISVIAERVKPIEAIAMRLQEALLEKNR